MAFRDFKGSLTVQKASATNPTTATGSVTVAAGDLIFVLISENTDVSSVTGITDNLGNSYNLLKNFNNVDFASARSHWARASGAGTLTAVNVAMSASIADVAVAVAVFEGPFATTPVGANPNTLYDASSPFTGPATGTLDANNHLVIHYATAASGNATASPSVGTTRVNISSGTGIGSVSAHISSNLASSTASQTATWTFSGSPFATSLGAASFKQTGSAPTTHQGTTSIGSTTNVISNAKRIARTSVPFAITSAVAFATGKTIRRRVGAASFQVLSTVTSNALKVRFALAPISASVTATVVPTWSKAAPISIVGTSSGTIVTPKRIRRATILSAQAAATINTPAFAGIEATKGTSVLRNASIQSTTNVFVSGSSQVKSQASTHIQAQSNISFGTTGSQDYLASPTQDYLQRSFPDLTWMQSQANNVLSSYVASVSIQSSTDAYAEPAAANYLGIGIQQKSNMRVIPTHIKGSQDIDKGSGAKQASIHLSRTVRGEAVATISGLRWSNFKGLGTGFRIVSGEYPYESIAVFLEDPQFKSNTILIDIKTPFSTATLAAGEWRFDVPEGTDFNQEGYTPNYFRKSDLLSLLMKDMRKHVVEPSQYLTERMKDFRRWDRIDPEFIGPLGHTMGMYIRMDRFDDEARRRAVHEWIQFCQYAGTESFMGFEGYALDTIFTLEHLWTNDYKNFVGREFAVDDSYYPTNHVALRYDAEIFDIYNPEDIKYIYDLFYKLASVPLVLEALYAYTHDDSTVWIQGVGYEQEYAPIETNEFPPNFWVIGVEQDILYIFDKPNELPPNFWIVPADQDIEYIFDFAEIIINPDSGPTGDLWPGNSNVIASSIVSQVGAKVSRGVWRDHISPNSLSSIIAQVKRITAGVVNVNSMASIVADGERETVDYASDINSSSIIINSPKRIRKTTNVLNVQSALVLGAKVIRRSNIASSSLASLSVSNKKISRTPVAVSSLSSGTHTAKANKLALAGVVPTSSIVSPATKLLKIDPSITSTTITVSNLGRTASKVGTGSTWTVAKSKASYSSDKYWFQYTPSEFSDTAIGLCKNTAPSDTNTYPGNNTDFVAFWGSGYTAFSDSGGGWAFSITGYGVSSLVTICFDLNSGLIWRAIGTGNWNDNASANPASGTGGYTITGLGTGVRIYCALRNTDAGTFNFGTESPVRSIPSGFLSAMSIL